MLFLNVLVGCSSNAFLILLIDSDGSENIVNVIHNVFETIKKNKKTECYECSENIQKFS